MRVRGTTGFQTRLFGFLALLSVLLAGCQMPSQKMAPSGGVSAAAVPPAHHIPGPYRVTLLADGTEVEFLGEISPAAMTELQQVLDTHPEVRVLQLTSPGGGLQAVRSIWPTLLERNLTTVVPFYCASACAELFLAGKKRVLADGAALGFHQSHLTERGNADPAEVGLVTWFGNTEMVKLMLQRGVDPDFANRVVAVPHETFWYPSRQTLLAAKVITQSSGTATFAAPSTGEDLSALLDWSILNERLISNYRAAFPEEYADVRDKVWASVHRNGWNSDKTLMLIVKAIEDAVASGLSVASDSAAAAYVRGLGSAFAYVAQENPSKCYTYFDDDLLDGSRLSLQGADRLDAHFAQMTADLFYALRWEERQPPPTAEQYEAAQERMGHLIARDGFFSKSDLAVTQSPKSHPERFCIITAAIFDYMLRQPQPDQSILVRGWMLFTED